MKSPGTGVPPRSNRIGLPISTGIHSCCALCATTSTWSGRTPSRSESAGSKVQSPYSRKNRISVPASPRSAASTRPSGPSSSRPRPAPRRPAGLAPEHEPLGLGVVHARRPAPVGVEADLGRERPVLLVVGQVLLAGDAAGLGELARVPDQVGGIDDLDVGTHGAPGWVGSRVGGGRSGRDGAQQVGVGVRGLQRCSSARRGWCRGRSRMRGRSSRSAAHGLAARCRRTRRRSSGVVHSAPVCRTTSGPRGGTVTAACSAGLICASARSIERWLSVEQGASRRGGHAGGGDVVGLAGLAADALRDVRCSPPVPVTSVVSVQVRVVSGVRIDFEPAKSSRWPPGC